MPPFPSRHEENRIFTTLKGRPSYGQMTQPMEEVMSERATNDQLRADATERVPETGSRDYEAGTTPGSHADARMTTADLAYGRDDGNAMKQPAATDDEERISLIQEADVGGYRERWTSIQTHFIDEPRETVSDADELVAEVIQSLARRFAEERQNLEQQWQSGSEVSTEDLRQAMQHYRSFFERLLAA